MRAVTTTPPTTATTRRRSLPRLAPRLLGPLYVTGVFWVRLIVLGSRGPDFLVRPIVAAATTMFFLCLFRLRRVTRQNLEGVLGPCGFLERQKRFFRALHARAWSLVERFEQFGAGVQPDVEFVGRDAWHSFEQADRGCLVITAHFGSWEIAPLLPVAALERHMHLVREREEDSATQRYYESLLARHPRKVACTTHFAGDDPQLGAKLLLALRRGDVVTMAADRPRTGMASIQVPMFGKAVALPIGPLALARAAAVPLYPVFVFRTGRRSYRAVARTPFSVASTSDRGADLAAAAARVAREVEWSVSQAPYQWFRSEEVWV